MKASDAGRSAGKPTRSEAPEQGLDVVTCAQGSGDRKVEVPKNQKL